MSAIAHLPSDPAGPAPEGAAEGAAEPAPAPAGAAEGPEAAPAPAPGRPLRRYTPQQGDRDMLLVSLVVMILSVALGVSRGGQSVAPFGMGELSLPPICPTKVALDIDCPGCGLTRSFVALAHGDLGGAWDFNRVGPILFAFVAFQIPYRSARLIAWIGRRRRGEAQPRPAGWMGTAAFAVIASALFVNWVVNIVASWVSFVAQG